MRRNVATGLEIKKKQTPSEAEMSPSKVVPSPPEVRPTPQEQAPLPIAIEEENNSDMDS